MAEQKLINPEGYFIFLQAHKDDSPYSLASIYGLNLDQLNLLANALSHLTFSHNGPIILGGDLNLITDPKFDYSNQKMERDGGYFPKSPRKGFFHLLQEYQLTDIWHHLHLGDRILNFSPWPLLLLFPELITG